MAALPANRAPSPEPEAPRPPRLIRSRHVRIQRSTDPTNLPEAWPLLPPERPNDSASDTETDDEEANRPAPRPA
jgi:hypothetical protein